MACYNKKSDLKNQITVTVKVIDKYTRQPKSKDTVEIRIGKPAFPMRKYVKVGKYITDSLGIVKVNLNYNERYSFTTVGFDTFASIEFAEGELKDGQKVIIEVVPPEKRKIAW
ncbi:MAG: hypothetical protein V4589_10650 [Bacteroidota bacterium]